ncbi:MAG TPA: hypothetical protein VJ793_27320 [Anaerolineae bacterium]|nr:hypothetical protein [Anaerolineae bacterium]
MGLRYTCSHCRKELVSETSEEEALAEERELWGFNEEPDNRDVLCEDCFQEFLAWRARQGTSDA